MQKAVVFDVGRVLFEWQLAALFEKLIDDRDELDWFLANVVTEEWHFEHDRGRALADMVPERIAQFPAYESHINAYATRFNETVPGPVPGSHAIVERLAGAGVPLFCLTNFGDEFWQLFRPTQPIFGPRPVPAPATISPCKPSPTSAASLPCCLPSASSR